MLPDNNFKIPSYVVHDIGEIETLSQIYPQNVSELSIPDIWKKTKGGNVVVAVLDTGTPKDHSDLMQNIDLSKCRSFVPNEDIWDAHHGHSTHVSGTLGAVDNHHGIVGIAPEVTIVTVKVLGKNGRSSSDSIKRGLEYCLNIKPDIINMSLGSTASMPDVHEIIKKIDKAGIIIIAAAGNNGKEEILYPANYDEVIAVGSYGPSLIKSRSEFSSYGNSLDIMAPGEEILSTYINGQYAVLSGTSMAAPVISGIAALMISYFKKHNIPYSPKYVKDLMLLTAVDIGSYGFDKQHGHGMVNPLDVFKKIDDPTTLFVPRKDTLFRKIKKWFKKWA